MFSNTHYTRLYHSGVWERNEVQFHHVAIL